MWFSIKHTSDGWWTREKSYGAGKVSVSLQKIPALHICSFIFTDWWRAFEYNLTLGSKPLSFPRWPAASSYLRYQKKGLREFVFCRTKSWRVTAEGLAVRSKDPSDSISSSKDRKCLSLPSWWDPLPHNAVRLGCLWQLEHWNPDEWILRIFVPSELFLAHVCQRFLSVSKVLLICDCFKVSWKNPVTFE